MVFIKWLALILTALVLREETAIAVSFALAKKIYLENERSLGRPWHRTQFENRLQNLPFYLAKPDYPNGCSFTDKLT